MTVNIDDIARVLPFIPRDRKNPEGELGCLYTSYDGSHCIVGEILSRLGLYVPGNGVPYNEGEGIDQLVHFFPEEYDIDHVALQFLVGLQVRADTMLHSWGECIDASLDKYAQAHKDDEVMT